MGERLDHAWRVVATGFCFVVFGLGGAVLGLASPVLWLIPGRDRRTRVARFLVHHWFRFFIGLMRFVGVLSYELHGVERLRQPGLLVLANHPSLIDVVFLVSLIPQAGCVVRANLLKNPFTRGPILAAGYVTNDAGVALVDDCRHTLETGSTLVIFPEGTRTPRSGEVRLQRGAANVAVRCRHPITPVTFHVEPRMLCKGEPWYRVPPRRGHYTITVHPELAPPALGPDDAEPLAVRRLNAQLHDFFQQEARRAGA